MRRLGRPLLWYIFQNDVVFCKYVSFGCCLFKNKNDNNWANWIQCIPLYSSVCSSVVIDVFEAQPLAKLLVKELRSSNVVGNWKIKCPYKMRCHLQSFSKKIDADEDKVKEGEEVNYRRTRGAIKFRSLMMVEMIRRLLLNNNNNNECRYCEGNN